jgi:CxxC-x17-CxxC domain-containing protein
LPIPLGLTANRNGTEIRLRPEEQREWRDLSPTHGDSDMPDIEITCAECGNAFPFTEREQDYYQERNLTHPKRCKPCRDARRSNFGGPKGAGGERQRFEITCDQCGKTDTVPFKPSTGRPVLCGDCFGASRATQPRT